MAYYIHIDSNKAASSLIRAVNQTNQVKVTKMTKSAQTQQFIISAHNSQGAYCKGGTATSLTAAIKKARETFGKGWRIDIWLDDDCVKSWTIRK